MLLSTVIVATIPSSSVSSSASSFEWICSTEAAPWRNYTANASLRTALLCTPQPHTNCHGGKDLSMSRAPTTAAACCAYCGTVAGCAAWTFDTTASHVPFCYAKTACPTPDTADPNTVSGFGQPAPPTPAPPVSLHIDCGEARGQDQNGSKIRGNMGVGRCAQTIDHERRMPCISRVQPKRTEPLGFSSRRWRYRMSPIRALCGPRSMGARTVTPKCTGPASNCASSSATISVQSLKQKV